MTADGFSITLNVNVMTITLCRPPVNALNDRMVVAISSGLDEAYADPNLCALVIRSDQRVFCAGGDIAQMRKLFGTADGPRVFTETVVRPLQKLFQRIEDAPFVTIAEMAGDALGGGLELALSCDFRVAATEAKFGLVEVHLGLLAAAGGTQRLTRLLGRGLAHRMILRGETVTGAAAETIGLMHWHRPAAELPGFATALAEEFAALPRSALRANKRCIRAALDPTIDGFEMELAQSQALYSDPATVRLLNRFFERKPF